jgi:hypothetical protein
MNQPRGNLQTGERVASAVAGTVLSLLAARTGGPFMKIAAGTAALSLFGRAFAGHCAMKAALTHESTFREGVQDQWHRVREPLRRADRRATPAHAGDPSERASWISHQNGRVTGTGVAPGSGDSEAGLSGVNS